MQPISIVTDSTAYIPENLLQEYDVKVVPQILIWDDKTMQDGVDISPMEFYERLKSSETMPTTSQATVGSFKEIFEPLVADGHEILAILVSDKLSGTIQSAVQTKAMFPDARIEILNSVSTAMALGFQVLAAARAAREGKSMAELVELANGAVSRTGVLLVVDTLEFLHRGGRIGGASRLLGTALNLKPILEMRDGAIEPVEKVRTKSKAHGRLLDILEQRIAGRTPVRLAALHAAAEQDAKAMLEKASARFSPIEALVSDVSPVVGSHVGPGTVAMSYCVEL
jgi:DegV family protein with EDD domain